jgi:hypothetical protein
METANKSLQEITVCMKTERAQNILKHTRTKQQSTDRPNLSVTQYNKTVYLGDQQYGEK